MGEDCYRSQLSNVAVEAWIDKDQTYIHRVTYRSFNLRESDVESLLKINGPDLEWLFSQSDATRIDWTGKKNGKLINTCTGSVAAAGGSREAAALSGPAVCAARVLGW
jgi:hypothetical protein